jgi:XTP/dITP diphosphohydrolase
MQQWVLASNNTGKLREFAALFEHTAIDLVPQGRLGVAETAEPYGTFLENALTKARHASRSTGLPALADDSGLTVLALGGQPGVHSARYASGADGHKSDEANNRKLLDAMAGQSERAASFVCVLVFVRHAEDPNPVVAQGVWLGEIADTPSGGGGFGYDPLFRVPALGQTAGELPAAIKNVISHRGQALVQLMQQLRANRLV